MLRTVSAGGKEGHKAKFIWVEHLVPSLQEWQEAQGPLSFGWLYSSWIPREVLR